MVNAKWSKTLRENLKSALDFGWSISQWEKNKKLRTKVGFRYDHIIGFLLK